MTATLTTQQMYDDAVQKLHLLQTGRLSVKVHTDGYEVTYERADLEKLKSYVATLEERLAGRRTHGALTFWF